MEHTITVLTISNVIPAGGIGLLADAPWSNGAPIVMNDPVLSTIVISDDDDAFRSGTYTYDETDQLLVNDAVFGHGDNAKITPAGTQMSNFVASIITSDAEDSYVVMYPRSYEHYGAGTEFGGRQSLLIFPIPDDNGIEPVFDPGARYTYAGVRSFGPGDDAQPWPAPTASACFAQDTLIQTASGPCRVQDLRPGTLLRTMDHGYQPVLWIGHRQMQARDLDQRPDQRPILIAAHALGPGQPGRDLVVSPQHRLLIRSPIAERMTGEAEVLIAARHLVGLPGITVQGERCDVTYWHVLLADHQVLVAEGAWAESLLPGPVALRALGAQNARRIRQLTAGRALTPARPLLSGRHARRLVQRHDRNRKALLDA
ncbi:Hint domain-containing protein [Paracoccus haeundaensis]|uniref:Hint domain-containing protein n=1 Tax=Paracoccus haeundaensis TaxID=225362 RepID=A0A5C4RB88_9RHOB|nr:Hint domain-containing protein [Paracoccus haeundaensis]TNH41172.1 Hint domain-containing protein [Paracoccus haeundaensis]